jgi:hypothetical protein
LALRSARRGRAAAAFVAALGLVTTFSSARGETPGFTAPPRWLFEPGARLNVDFPIGDARSLIHWALGAGLSLSAGREGSAHRWRASFELEPVTDIGPGASLELLRAQLGFERLWRRHLVTALDLGGVFRRLSIWDQLTRTTPGVGASAEVGWRFLAAARWSMTGGFRYSASWFTTDGFVWQQLGVFFGLERIAAGPR